MSYALTIGKARYVGDYDEYGEEYIRWTVDQCEGPAPHRDQWESLPNIGGPVRLPSYGLWWEVLEMLPVFGALWHRLEGWTKEHKAEIIPVTEYARELDAVEQEAAAAPEEFAARALWFTRWSRHALALYGEAACFETPGEWISWECVPA